VLHGNPVVDRGQCNDGKRALLLPSNQGAQGMAVAHVMWPVARGLQVFPLTCACQCQQQASRGGNRGGQRALSPVQEQCVWGTSAYPMSVLGRGDGACHNVAHIYG